jgi:hypothetical protein
MSISEELAHALDEWEFARGIWLEAPEPVR